MEPFTFDQVLQHIHVGYEGDTDFLDFDDEETQLRVFIVKDSIREWINRFPEKREVFADLTSAADGDKTTSAGDTTYDCPTNFVRPSNIVTIGSKDLSYIPPENVALRLQADPNSSWFTITGRPGAYILRINPAPTGSETIEYDYWKRVTMPSVTTDTIEISRPFFCVHYVLWKLFGEDDPDRALEHKNLMEEEERLERVALAKNPGGENKVEVRGEGFGIIGSGSSDILTDS